MGKNIKGKELGEGICQRKDGLYMARFCSIDGKRATKYFHKLSDARKWLIESKYEDTHGQASRTSGTTVNNWFWHWIDEIKGDNIRYGTRHAYITRFENRIDPIIGPMVLSDVKPMDCQMVLTSAQNEGEKPGSVRKLRVIMREFFEAAKDNELINDNPIRKSVTYAKEEPAERRVLTVSEEQKLLDTAEGHPYYPIFAFGLQTGMRVGELTGLKWEDIDWTTRTLDVERSLEYRSDRQQFVENPPKSRAGFRTIPLTREAIDILRSVKESSQNLPHVEPYGSFVFRNSEGKPPFRGNLNRALRELSRKADIESLSMHTLRHTFATRCIESGMRPKTLQKILGHSTLNLTMNLYVHVTDETLVTEMEKFESMTSKSK